MTDPKAEALARLRRDWEEMAQAAYEAGARSRDEEVARFRKFYGDEVCVDCGERYSTKPRIKECRIAHLKAYAALKETK